MSLYSAMRSGVAGMNAQSSRLAAISDNISNSSTTGYKRSDVDFTTLVTSSGSTSTYSAGGVTSAVRYEVTKDGTIDGTQSATDLAINGDGFFVVANGTGASPTYGLTRAGSFLPDDTGFLRNSAGQYLEGWKLNPDGSLPAVSATSFAGLTPINTANLVYGGSRSTEMNFSGNLPAQAATGTTFTSTGVLYDGLGNPLDLGLTWTRTATANQWTVAASSIPTGYTVAGLPATVDFAATGPASGMPTSVLPTITLTSPASPTADTVNVKIGDLTQLNGDFVPQFTSNGAQVGRVSSVQVDDSGKLWAIYDNGSRQALYQIPVATVINPDGLVPGDGNVYTLGADSGAMTLSQGGAGKAGKVSGYSLEASNVDTADELVSLIETQRAYSSAATIVRTTDEMLQETTNLKR